MEVAEQAKAYIEKAVKFLPEDHHSYAFFPKFLESFENAKELADDDEKRARIANAAVATATRLTMFLFVEGILSDELEAEWRKLPKPEETEKMLDELRLKRQARYDEIHKTLKEAEDEQHDFDVFNQVLGGLSKEEAEKRIEMYKNAGGM